MKKLGFVIITTLMLAGLIGVALFSAYGLTPARLAGKTDVPLSVTTESAQPLVKAPAVATMKSMPLPVPAPLPSVPASVLPAQKETTLNLLVLGKAIDMTGAPIIVATDGKTMLPLRKLGEALGYTVKWDDLIKAAVLQKNTESIIVKKDSLNFTWGTISRVFSKKPELLKNRLYVPVDFITGNPSYQVNQTAASITVDLAGAAAKQVLTGEIEEITVYSNGLELKVKDSKNESVSLYVTDKTQITNYSTGAVIDRSMLKTGTKAIFSYMEVFGEEQNTYDILSGVEVVELVSVPAATVPITTESIGD